MGGDSWIGAPCSYQVILWKFHANSIFPCITNCRLFWKWVLLMELLVSQLFKHSTTFFSVLEGIGHYVSHAKSSEIQSSLFLLKISRIISIWPCMIYPPLNTYGNTKNCVLGRPQMIYLVSYQFTYTLKLDFRV